MKRIYSVLLLAFACLTLSFSQKKELTIGVENLNYLPYYTTSSSGEYMGFARELLDAFAKSKGYTFTYQALPLNKLYLFHKLQKIDLKFPDDPMWNTKMKEGVTITYSDDVCPYTDGVMVKPDNKGKAIKKLGAANGFSPWPYMKQIESGEISLIESPTLEVLAQQGLQGIVDGIYVNTSVAHHILTEKLNTNSSDLVFDNALPHSTGMYKASSSTSPELIAEFNAFLKENETLVKQLISRHQLK